VPDSIVEIKKKLDDRIGSHVLVKAQAGRKRIATHHGVLSKTYPAVFVIHLNGDDEGSLQRISYSYTDLLTRNISLAFDDEEA
jgi:uncharacterized protein Veg